MKEFRKIITLAVVAVAGYLGYQMVVGYLHENAVLKAVIERLQADSRVAEVLVTNVNYDERTQKNFTTIKFVEYDTRGNPLEPRYFTFSGNVIQFQSLVIRFDDIYVRQGDKLRGRSAYLFWKVFMLDGKNTQEYDITKVNEIPGGYRTNIVKDPFEERLWRMFWQNVFSPEQARKNGVKNAQIEAPGTIFIPGYLYTIRIEHDGGLRIDAARLPSIVRGETIPK